MDPASRRFWHRTDPQPDRIALLDAAADRSMNYRDLAAEVSRLAESLSGRVGPAFLQCHNDIPSVLAYLACIEAGIPVALIDPDLDGAFFANLLDRYRPDIVVGEADLAASSWSRLAPAGPNAPVVMVRDRRGEPDPHPDLCLLLSTSGSTGSPKLVRLAYDAVASNADSISAALGILPDDRAVTCLPLHYSYGLSVLNSHLAAGATTVVTASSPMTREFWDQFRSTGCTSLAGVPYSYAMYDRLDLSSMGLETLRVMTQAGGRLSVDSTRKYWEFMDRNGGLFFTMYGQTEATARITILPHEEGDRRRGSVGRAIPGGSLAIDPIDGGVADSRPSGEVVYTGANVMMGYATGRADLAAPDHMKGRLATGDIGYLEDGYLYVTGRSKRIGKVFGLRVNLDEVEALASRNGRAAVVTHNERIVVFLEPANQNVPEKECARDLATLMNVHFSGINVRYVDALPTTTSGKVDYPALLDLA